MVFKQYEDKEELRNLQLAQVDILEDLDRVCIKLDIPYFAIGGTAIGAVRNGGFIPWDDDIDIGMLRVDYERFLELAPDHIAPQYEIVNNRTEKHFPACISNMSIKGTYDVPEAFKRCPYQFAIGLDIFAYDTVPSNPKDKKTKLRRAWFWSKLCFLRATPFPMLPFGGIAGKLIHGVCALIHGILVILHVSPQWLHRKHETAVLLFNGSSPFVTEYTDTNPDLWQIDTRELFPLERVAFENIKTNLPKCNDASLRRGFGDYMQLPPEDQRKNHYPIRLDFGTWTRR